MGFTLLPSTNQNSVENHLATAPTSINDFSVHTPKNRWKFPTFFLSLLQNIALKHTHFLTNL
ncbi:hypothetical protein HMPREF9999_01031 [Alloprevotella sp. oral taxon 473 str. F0040]|nr:hypothetical protein HMPREF9999_01031 [Alloprevotella sp. oral taxon 473 str. F0040]